jgi:hypothetical protein
VHNLVKRACCLGDKFLMSDLALLSSARSFCRVVSVLCIDSVRLWIANLSPDAESNDEVRAFWHVGERDWV